MTSFVTFRPNRLRSRPGHGSIPAAYISMIGVDERFQGRGFGGDLLVDGLRRIAIAADAIGIAVVMLDVLDRGDPHSVARRIALYEGYGFTPLAANPLRMFFPIATVRSLLAGSDRESAMDGPCRGEAEDGDFREW